MSRGRQRLTGLLCLIIGGTTVFVVFDNLRRRGALSNVEAGLEDIEELLRKGRFAEAHARVGELEDRLGRTLAGGGAYGEDPTRSDRHHALLLRGHARMELGRLEEAAQDFSAAGELNHDSWDSYWGLAQVYHRMPDGCEGALREMDSALRHGHNVHFFPSADMPKLHRAKAECHAVKAEYESALKELDKAVELWRPAGEHGRKQIEDLSALKARYEISALRLMEHLGKEGGWWRYGGMLHLSEPLRKEKAAEWARLYEAQARAAVLAIASVDAEPGLFLARARLRTKERVLDGASADLEAAGRSPELRSAPDYWIAKAELDAALHDRRAALPSARKALELRPGHVEAAALLAELEGRRIY